jgi:hypothetical protein
MLSAAAWSEPYADCGGAPTRGRFRHGSYAFEADEPVDEEKD